VPSGISTEQLAVDAIVHTLHAAVPQVRLLKILIAGQEVETLAGHVDLTSAFDLSAMTAAPAGQGQGATPTGGATPAPAPATQPAAPPPAGKTPAPQEKKPPVRPGA
ncbi:MAG TPA: hypothetical protein VKG84_01305, partial [Candidatus Acidoferrales bacterium]|nr:hypothetical protein [Candidatus Acidoferrales bacterium]